MATRKSQFVARIEVKRGYYVDSDRFDTVQEAIASLTMEKCVNWLSNTMQDKVFQPILIQRIDRWE